MTATMHFVGAVYHLVDDATRIETNSSSDEARTLCGILGYASHPPATGTYGRRLCLRCERVTLRRTPARG